LKKQTSNKEISTERCLCDHIRVLFCRAVQNNLQIWFNCRATVNEDHSNISLTKITIEQIILSSAIASRDSNIICKQLLLLLLLLRPLEKKIYNDAAGAAARRSGDEDDEDEMQTNDIYTTLNCKLSKFVCSKLPADLVKTLETKE
jgi:hypothetical protein